METGVIRLPRVVLRMSDDRAKTGMTNQVPAPLDSKRGEEREQWKSKESVNIVEILQTFGNVVVAREMEWYSELW